jgi:hypothetical protein
MKQPFSITVMALMIPGQVYAQSNQKQKYDCKNLQVRYFSGECIIPSNLFILLFIILWIDSMLF